VSGSPEELLRSALEKIVFFECRLSSLESELEGARSAAARAREEAQSARRREGELEALFAQARGEHAVAVAHNAELVERVRILETERERFLAGMVERARVAGAPSAAGDDPGDESDLAGFIAELRLEIEQLRAWKRAAEAQGVRVVGADAMALTPPLSFATATPLPVVAPNPSPNLEPDRTPSVRPERSEAESKGPCAPTSPPARADRSEAESKGRAPSLSTLASRFSNDGRLSVAPAAARALPTAFSTRAERALYEHSLDDLSSADPGARRRAADCLRVLGSTAAAPLVAAAIGREPDADVKGALLAALGVLGEPSAADLAARELADPRPGVRAAALDAAAALAKDRALPHLARALGDPSALVRRRAVVLLGFTRGDGADDALASALSDRDAGVARAAAAALAGRPSARAQGALARALDHREAAVRGAASRAVARWAGESPDAAAPDVERRRASRRIAERLLELDGSALRSAVTRVAVPATAVAAPVRPERRAAESKGPLTPISTGTPSVRPERSAAESKGAPAPRSTTVAPAADPALADAALFEIRAALRGRTPDELASALGRDRPTVEAALCALAAQGRVARRGPRFYMS
jgi:HEAT repeat protein